MKKSFLLSAFACLALSLPACDKSDQDNDEEGDSTDEDDGGTADTADEDSGDDGDSDGGTGTAEDGGSSEDGGVLEDPDTGDGVECDIWAQDCPDGSKCMPWANDGGNSWNATKCTPLDAAPKEVGDTCTVQGSGVSGVDDCVTGAMCWGVDPTTNMGVCNAMCTGSQAEPMCPTGSFCSITNNGVLILCLDGCDPLLQDCEGDNLCILAASEMGFICVLDASTEGEGNPGDACEFGNVCQAGNTCIDGTLIPDCTTDYCCTEYCDIDQANSCAQMADGSQCVAIWEEGEGPPDWGHVGRCQLPM